MTTQVARGADEATVVRKKGPALEDMTHGLWHKILVGIFVGVPTAVLLAAPIMALFYNLISWHDIVIALPFWFLTNVGVGTGLHRLFTHKAFVANPWLKYALAIQGSMALEGPVVTWVADHRRHHAFADKEGDPHSPWKYGDSAWALAKGLFHSHTGWLFAPNRTSQTRYAPDLLADKGLVRISKLFPLWAALSLLLPPVIGGLWSGTLHGALTAFIWGSLARIALLHHTTWSVNSICHTFGDQVFESRDKSRNVWWLAILTLGESYHNTHHADPTCARHGVDPGQIDINAEVIRLCERAGWASNVKWPDRARLDAKRIAKQAA